MCNNINKYCLNDFNLFLLCEYFFLNTMKCNYIDNNFFDVIKDKC